MGVKVESIQKNKSDVKYRYQKNLLKYSNEVFVLRYFPSLHSGVDRWWKKQTGMKD